MENPPQIADQTDNFSHFDFANLTQADSYKLLVSVVMPRPVAWVVSRDEQASSTPRRSPSLTSSPRTLRWSRSQPPTVPTKTLATTFASAASW